MRTLLAALICLMLAACGGISMSGSDSADSLAAPDSSFTLKLPPGWSVKQRAGGEGGYVSVLAHKDAAATGKGYPTMVIREVLEPTPQGVLDLMAKDKNLEYSELWNVSPEKYQLKQALLDDSSRVLSYWLSPRDGQGLEYYSAVILTGFGRVEMIGVAQAGTVTKYVNDFNMMFTSLDIADKARFNPATAGETGAYLRQTYMRALEREKAGLARQASETSAWAGSAAGLSVQEKGFLSNAYGKAVSKALESCSGLIGALGKPGGKESAELQRLTERLDEAANALETIQLNISESQSRISVEKSAARVRRMATLGREVAKLPL